MDYFLRNLRNVAKLHVSRLPHLVKLRSINMLKQIKLTLHNSISVSPNRVASFFKTGKGDYAEGDVFIGVTVPNLRKIAKNYISITLNDLQKLLQSKINEERLLALIILVQQYKEADENNKEIIYKFYIKNLKHVNNWNLVDSSAHFIIGAHLCDKNRRSLITLARSDIMWERRIAIVSTWYFIRNNDLTCTFDIAALLINDSHDLIHKAVGWMLREAGKRNQIELMKFLDKYAEIMPRTMLRYSIEKFTQEERKKYLIADNPRVMS
jgi:3-methyladenine DNA glycosylase AlkD